MELKKILEAVSQGRTSVEAALKQIEKQMDKIPIAKGNEKDGVRATLERWKKNVSIDELRRFSGQLVQQIAEHVPPPLDGLANHHFSPSHPGVDSRLSLFRGFSHTDDCSISDNKVMASQWFDVSLRDASHLQSNAVKGSQLSGLTLGRSNFVSNSLGLCRMGSLTLQEACVENNHFQRSSLTDVSFTESDFTDNTVLKSEISQTVINASRLAKNTFSGSDFDDCEFDQCEIQGFVFENCDIRGCSFMGVKAVAKDPVTLRGLTCSGMTIGPCQTADDFVAALKGQTPEEGERKTVVAPAPGPRPAPRAPAGPNKQHHTPKPPSAPHGPQSHKGPGQGRSPSGPARRTSGGGRSSGLGNRPNHNSHHSSSPMTPQENTASEGP